MSKKKKSIWADAATFNVMKASEGGPGYGMIATLKSAGIPARKAPSWCGSTSGYVGMVGIEVPRYPTRRYKRAQKIAGVA